MKSSSQIHTCRNMTPQDQYFFGRAVNSLTTHWNELDNSYFEYDKIVGPFKTGKKTLRCGVNITNLDMQTLFSTDMSHVFRVLAIEIPELDYLKIRHKNATARMKDIIRNLSRNYITKKYPDICIYSVRTRELVNVTWMLNVNPEYTLGAEAFLNQLGDVDLTWIDEDLSLMQGISPESAHVATTLLDQQDDVDLTLMLPITPESAHAAATLLDQQGDPDLTWIDEDN